MVESSGLLNRRSALKRYRGFESLPLRHFNHFRVVPHPSSMSLAMPEKVDLQTDCKLNFLVLKGTSGDSVSRYNATLALQSFSQRRIHFLGSLFLHPRQKV